MVLVTRQPMVDDSGLGQDGTYLNAAFFNQIYGQIDAQCNSAANPTLYPFNIIDEVVAARGVAASLSARLAVSLDTAGNLIVPAGVTSVAQLQTQVASRNLATNDDMSNWGLGSSVAPVGYSITGAGAGGATIAQAGAGQADTTTLGAGKYCAKLTNVTGDAQLRQSIISTANFGLWSLAGAATGIKGRWVSVGMWMQTAVNNCAKVFIDDGAVVTGSTVFCPSDGAPHWVTASVQISNGATKLDVYGDVAQAGTVYMGGLQVEFSQFGPTTWNPMSQTPIAPGVSRLLDSQISTGGVNGGAGSDGTLFSFAVLPGQLAINNQALRVTLDFTMANNANTKVVKFWFGATSVTVTNFPWQFASPSARIVAVVTRTGATAQWITSSGLVATSVATGGVMGGIASAAAETLSNSITLKYTGNGTAASDIVAYSMITEYLTLN